MGKFLRFAIIGAVAAAAFFIARESGIGGLLRQALNSGPSENQIASELLEAANALNAQAPIELDQYTTLISAETDHIIMIYNNRVSLDPSELDLSTFETERRTHLVGFVCGNEGMRLTLDAGGSFKYNWVDQSSQPIGSVTISASDCPT